MVQFRRKQRVDFLRCVPPEINSMENKKTILIVEDERPMLKALSDKFAYEGFRVLEARDGVMGLNIALENRPNIILLDIVMPIMNGMEMLKKIREVDDWGKKVPVIVLTNLTPNDKLMSEVTENEPSYYLIKSEWKLNDIVQKVKDCS